MSFTPRDRSNLIRLASSLPVGDEFRRSILSGISKTAVNCTQVTYSDIVRVLPDQNWDWKTSPLNPTLPSVFENYMKTVQKVLASKMKVNFGEGLRYKWDFKKTYGEYRSGYYYYIRPWAGWSIRERVKTPFWLSLHVSSDNDNCITVPIPPSAQKGRKAPFPGAIYVDESDLTPEKFANWAFDAMVDQGAPFGGNISPKEAKGRELVVKFLKEAVSALRDPRSTRGYSSLDIPIGVVNTPSVWNVLIRPAQMSAPPTPEDIATYKTAMSNFRSLVSKYNNAFEANGVSLSMTQDGEIRTNVKIEIAP